MRYPQRGRNHSVPRAGYIFSFTVLWERNMWVRRRETMGSLAGGVGTQTGTAAPPAAEFAGSPLPLQPQRGAIPSASSAPKGRHTSAQGSALGTGHTPDSQPRRGAIPQPRAAPWVPGIPQILSPEGAPYLAARCPWTVGMPPRQGSISFWIPFPGRCPGLRNGRAFSAPRSLAFATRPAGSLPQESRDPFCSPDAETIETKTLRN
jgi:hypothetical protein